MNSRPAAAASARRRPGPRRGDERHDGEPPGQPPTRRRAPATVATIKTAVRRQKMPSALALAEEEHHERPELERQLEARVRAPCAADRWGARSRTPSVQSGNGARRNRARRRAAGRRSPSPTPMKCTGSPVFAAIADQDAAARGAVELGHDEPGHPRLVAKTSTWFSAFWPVVASSVNSTACGARRIVLADHADDLRELGHQLRLVLQPPGGVDEQHVGAGFAAPPPARRRRAPPRRSRARARSPARRRARPRSSAARSRRRETCRRPRASRSCLRAEASGELADGGGLAGAVDADHQDHEGRLRGVDRKRHGHRRQHLLDLCRRARRAPPPALISLSSRSCASASAMRAACRCRGRPGSAGPRARRGVAAVEPSLGEDVGDAGGELAATTARARVFSRSNQLCCGGWRSRRRASADAGAIGCRWFRRNGARSAVPAHTRSGPPRRAAPAPAGRRSAVVRAEQPAEEPAFVRCHYAGSCLQPTSSRCDRR